MNSASFQSSRSLLIKYWSVMLLLGGVLSVVLVRGFSSASPKLIVGSALAISLLIVPLLMRGAKTAINVDVREAGLEVQSILQTRRFLGWEQISEIATYQIRSLPPRKAMRLKAGGAIVILSEDLAHFERLASLINQRTPSALHTTGGTFRDRVASL
jgi:hypothetical protein